MLISLIIYMLTGGADFGGGIWDLFATGRRANAQRFGPIWEANHVWLIVIVAAHRFAARRLYFAPMMFNRM